MFLARPLATIVSTVGSGFELREKALLGWAGLRGAVPVVLAIFPVIEGVDPRQGALQHRVLRRRPVDPAAGHDDRARRPLAGVTSDEPRAAPSVVEVGTIRQLGADVVEDSIRRGDAAIGVRLRDLGLPRDALVSLLVRSDEALPPRGSTRLEAGDRLYVLVRREVTGVRRRRASAGASVRSARPAPAAHVHRQRADLHDAAVVGRRRRPDASARSPGSRSSSGSAPAGTCPGALVILADGRFAATGPILMMGPPGQLQSQVRRRLIRATDDAEIAWWQEVIGACAL